MGRSWLGYTTFVAARVRRSIAALNVACGASVSRAPALGSSTKSIAEGLRNSGTWHPVRRLTRSIWLTSDTSQRASQHELESKLIRRGEPLGNRDPPQVVGIGPNRIHPAVT